MKTVLMFKSFSFIIALLIRFLVSCSGVENYKKAYGFKYDGKTFVMLKGKRQLRAHDPASVFSNKTYEDSIILQVPSLNDGTIKGNDIPARKGYYKYMGEVVIHGEKIQVNFSYDNTDDKKIEPTSWNGEYVLVSN